VQLTESPPGPASACLARWQMLFRVWEAHRDEWMLDRRRLVEFIEVPPPRLRHTRAHRLSPAPISTVQCLALPAPRVAMRSHSTVRSSLQ
jgi:hypothetical protein